MENKVFSISLILISIVVLATVASAAQITKIGTGHDPAIYGSNVTWSDDAGSIHLYDLTAQNDTTINSSSSSHPAIYGNTIVWHDESSGTSRLTVYDIPSGTMSYITQNVDSSSIPAIYGNRIVWSANYNRSNYNYNVYMHDISTSTQTKIAEGDSPDIYGTTITYGYDGDDGRNIAVYNISTNETIIVDSASQLFSPHIYDNRVIWSNFYSRDGFIEMYDLVTKKAIDVTSDNTGNTLPEYANYSYVDAGDDTGTHIDINGDKIVYSKSGDDQFGYAGVYIYDIPSAKNTPVYIYPKETHTTPDIYDNTVVWGFGDEIYVCNLTATATTVTQSPVAGFTSNVTSGYAPLTVSFADLSENATSWNWDFGDGATSTDQNPTHTYSAAGNYIVTLTVNNSAGSNTVTKNNYIIATKPGDAFIGGYAPLTVSFTDRSENAESWNWDFGDGATSFEQNPTHTYAKEGQYSVTLTISNAAGSNVATKYSYISVASPLKTPVAAFSASAVP